MSHIPRLYTPRLCLRPFTLADAPRIQELAGDKRIAATTAIIPHPYPDGLAATWIENLEPMAVDGRQFTFAITLTGTRTPGRENDLTDTGHYIGTIGIARDGDARHQRAELGYWVGVPYWNKGFVTEAGRAVLEFAFAKQKLRRVTSWHFAHNPASGRVMQKLGMTYEGTFRKHFEKWGEFHDAVCYAILQEEWQTRQRKPLRPLTVSQPAAFMTVPI